jgi:hypothetical protein
MPSNVFGYCLLILNCCHMYCFPIILIQSQVHYDTNSSKICNIYEHILIGVTCKLSTMLGIKLEMSYEKNLDSKS